MMMLTDVRYDKDGSGEIDMDEMVDIFSLMYSVQVI